MDKETIRLPARLYRQFDADLDLDVPAEAFGGWQTEQIELDPGCTALVSMHAWQFDGPDVYPGIYRVAEYLPRADEITRTVFPPLLAAARGAGMPVLHVVSDECYCGELPGYRKVVEMAGPEPEAPAGAPEAPALKALRELKGRSGYPGEHNVPDITAAHKAVRFPDEARPQDGELIARNAHQLGAACRHLGVAHLIYIGFAINWCLLMSPGGMLDMSRRGYMCSTVGEATTAVENGETAREQLCKRIALWRVALAFGFVFDAADLVAALSSAGG